MPEWGNRDYGDIAVSYSSYSATTGTVACTNAAAVEDEVAAGDIVVFDDDRENLIFRVFSANTARDNGGNVTGNTIVVRHLDGTIPAASVFAGLAADDEISVARAPTYLAANADEVFGVDASEEASENKVIAHSGWVLRKSFPQDGRRAGRVQYETIVASGSFDEGNAKGDAGFGLVVPKRKGKDTIVLASEDKTIILENFFMHVHEEVDSFDVSPTSFTNFTFAAQTVTPTEHPYILSRDASERGTEEFTVKVYNNSVPAMATQTTSKVVEVLAVSDLTRNDTAIPANTDAAAGTGDFLRMESYFEDAQNSITGIEVYSSSNISAMVTDFDLFSGSNRFVLFTPESGTTGQSGYIVVYVSGYDEDGRSVREDFVFNFTIT